MIGIERRGIRRYVCSGCGQSTGRGRDAKVRAWDDLPWAEHPVTLRDALRRLWCRHCGIRTERVGFADPHARLTRRFRQRIGLDCQSVPTSHAAVRHAVSWGTARRAERAFLEAWDRTGPKHRPRHISESMKFSAAMGSTSGRCCRTWCAETSSGCKRIAPKPACARCSMTAWTRDSARPCTPSAWTCIGHISTWSPGCWHALKPCSTSFTCCSTRAPRSMKCAAKDSFAPAR